ncbi:uncharacterized protein LOC134263274 [Saccostrea cucullata]|uniref:uncharacterized protein LOC134263274 n=1 Tax=Saccostrea cuccullata TaxID=36930 RepID=UPI002ED251B5
MCRDQHKDRIVHIRSDFIFDSLAILTEIKYDFEKSCQSKLSDLQKTMTKRTLRLKGLTELVAYDISELKKLKRSLISKLGKPKRKITKTEVILYKFEQFLDKPVQFLTCLKKTPIPRKKSISGILSFSLNRKINRMEIIKLLGEIQIKETKKRQIRNEQLLEVMHAPLLQKSFKLLGLCEVCHISCVTTDMVWISDIFGRIILINTKNGPLHIVKNSKSHSGGHSVTLEGNLIYIDINNNINKLSADNKTLNTLIKNIEQWTAECVLSSPSNGDLLVGIMKFDKKKYIYTDAKVLRCDSTGKQMQVIEHNNKGKKLYKLPKYITENHNGDIIVSDKSRVVVTDRGGRHRFSYGGLSPLGICVDALSHILVSDATTGTVRMIDKDGHYILMFTKHKEIHVSGGLDYDDKNHLLLVGINDKRDDNSGVNVYRYIHRKDQFDDDLHG